MQPALNEQTQLIHVPLNISTFWFTTSGRWQTMPFYFAPKSPFHSNLCFSSGGDGKAVAALIAGLLLRSFEGLLKGLKCIKWTDQEQAEICRFRGRLEK